MSSKVVLVDSDSDSESESGIVNETTDTDPESDSEVSLQKSGNKEDSFLEEDDLYNIMKKVFVSSHGENVADILTKLVSEVRLLREALNVKSS